MAERVSGALYDLADEEVASETPGIFCAIANSGQDVRCCFLIHQIHWARFRRIDQTPSPKERIRSVLDDF